MTPEALDYLSGVLDYIEQSSIMRGKVDFAVLRRDALAAAETAATTADTYPAIRLALERLGDRHSFLMDPEEARRNDEGGVVGNGYSVDQTDGTVCWIIPQSPAEQAELRAGDVVETVNGVPFAQLDQRERLEAAGKKATLAVRRGEETITCDLTPTALTGRFLPHGRRLQGDIGYLEVPFFSGPGESDAGRAFAAGAQRAIEEIDQDPVRGWIVDLRRNPGGNMWPMVAGVEPLLGEGTWDIFAAPEARTRAGYRDGEAFLEWDVEETPRLVQTTVATPYRLTHDGQPVAVLAGPRTASSGELVALCFRGLPHARSFGEPTAGVPTANQAAPLPDGAVLLLTVALGVDRADKTYDAPLEPDQWVKTEWRAFGTDEDPVVRAAVRWIREQT